MCLVLSVFMLYICKIRRDFCWEEMGISEGGNRNKICWYSGYVYDIFKNKENFKVKKKLLNNLGKGDFYNLNMILIIYGYKKNMDK